MLDVEATFCYLCDILCSGAIAARCCVAWGKFRKLLSVLTIRYLSPRICGKVYEVCVCPNNQELQRHLRKDCSMIHWICGIKDRDEIPSGSWPQKLGIEDITSVLRFGRLSPVSNLSQTFHFPALESKEGLGKHGLNVGRPMSVWPSWHRPTVQRCMESPCSACCCQPHRMGHGQHFNLRMDLDGWMVIGIYDFIDRPVDNVPSMCAWAVCWDTWPLGSIFFFMDIRRLLRVWQHLIRFKELGHTKSNSEFNTPEFSGLDNTAVIASKMFLDAMTYLFGDRCAICNTARDEIHIPWVNYHLVVDH